MKTFKRITAAGTTASLLLALCLLPGSFFATAHASKDGASGAKGRASAKVSPDLAERTRGKGGEREGGDKVTVIVQLGSRPKGQLNAFLNRNGVHVNADFKNLDALAVELPADAVAQLASFPEVTYVSADREVTSLGGHLSTTAGADAVRQQTTPTGTAYTLDGTGVGVAILDSGLYASHKSFVGRVGGSKDYTGEGRTDDPYGHGTHVAGILAGSTSVASGKYVGIAPGATIYNLRVLNSQGTGTVSAVLAAINDLLAYHAAYNIRVANMSLGMPAIDSYKNDPVCQAVRRLVDAGVVVVAAAGNDGKLVTGGKVYGLIHSPGNEPSALTVGATNTFGTIARGDDGVATYSSRGPTRSYWTDDAGTKHYDNLLKPDLVAPGNKIVSAEAVDNFFVRLDPTLDAGVSKLSTQKMMRMSGTSMATPVAAGTAALLLQLNPKLTPNMVKAILMYTAQPLAGFNTLEQGAGEINVEGAVRLAKLVRTNLTTAGEPLLTTSALPTPQTTLSYLDSATGKTLLTTFPWAEGLLLDHTYATGAELVTIFQGIYGTGVLFGDGITISEGVIFGDGTLLSDGVIFGDQILTSDGSAMGGGSSFVGAGVLFGDGVIFGDGLLASDSYVRGDGRVIGDYFAQPQAIFCGGDAGR
jgi:subtilisin family serine protease